MGHNGKAYNRTRVRVWNSYAQLLFVLSHCAGMRSVKIFNRAALEGIQPWQFTQPGAGGKNVIALSNEKVKCRLP